MRRYVADGALDILYPFRTVAFRVLGEIEGYDFVLKHRVDGGCIEFILLALVGESAFVGESPSGLLVETVAFIPPAVEYREVEHAVHLGFLARSAGCLQRTGRGVEPDVDTGNKTLGHNHVVVLKEYDLALELRHTRNLDYTLYQSLSGSVGRVSLA